MMADIEVRILYCSNEMVFKKAKHWSWDPIRLLVKYWQQHYIKPNNNAKADKKKKKNKGLHNLAVYRLLWMNCAAQQHRVSYNPRIPDFGARTSQQNPNIFEIYEYT